MLCLLFAGSGAPPAKKHKLYSPKDVSLAVASQYATLQDYSFFDRVHKVLRSQEVYENFIRYCKINQGYFDMKDFNMIMNGVDLSVY